MTDRQTDGQTEGRTDGQNYDSTPKTALSIARAVKTDTDPALVQVRVRVRVSFDCPVYDCPH